MTADQYRHRYLIGIAVTMAATLELIDTSIVHVAIPPRRTSPTDERTGSFSRN